MAGAAELSNNLNGIGEDEFLASPMAASPLCSVVASTTVSTVVLTDNAGRLAHSPDRVRCRLLECEESDLIEQLSCLIGLVSDQRSLLFRLQKEKADLDEEHDALNITTQQHLAYAMHGSKVSVNNNRGNQAAQQAAKKSWWGR
jgi:hypothetical protein